MGMMGLSQLFKPGDPNDSAFEKWGERLAGGSLPWELRFAKSGKLGLQGIRKQAGIMSAVGRSAKGGWNFGLGQKLGGVYINPLSSVFAFASAPRGHRLSAGVGGLLSGVASSAAYMVGGPALAMATSLLVDPLVSKTVVAGMQFLAGSDKREHALGMGSNFVDTQAAYTMRQAAAQEMSGSLFNARQHLGREGRLLHN